MPDPAALIARKRKWMVRVTDRHGNDMYLRRGAIAGAGQIVRFPTKQTAEINAEMIAPGLDDGSRVMVVPYDRDCE